MASDDLGKEGREAVPAAVGVEGRVPSPDAVQRIFLAVPVSERLRSLLRQKLSEANLPGRPVPAENWHITLRFLGPTTTPAATALVAALRNSLLGAPFSLTFRRLGAFPRPARASVLWLGIDEGADALAGLAARIEDVTRQVGFPPEDQPFRAHLTLSRLSPPADVRSFLDRDPGPGESMPVEEVVLFRSRLGRGPAVYEIIERIPLTG